jgi:MFS family permease
LAWSPIVLIIARLLQGAMAAIMVPQVMSLMQVMYPPEERGQVNGLFGGMAGIAASLGPVVGGLLIRANIFGLDWRPIFLINVPVGIFAFWAARKYLPAGKSAHPLKLDLVGTGLIMAALSLIVFPLIQGRDLHWPAWTFVSMALSLPFFALFGWWQVRKQRADGSPLVLPALFKKRSFSLGLITNVVFEGVMIGFFLIFTLMLQVGLGYSVVEAALTGIPTSIGIAMTFGLLAPKIIPKLGRYALTLGTVIMAVGLGLVTWIIQQGGVDTSPWAIAPALLPVGVGMAMIMAPVFAVVLNDVDHNHAGSASGVLNAVQQLGGAIGVAVVGVIFFGALSGFAGSSVDKVSGDIRTKLTAAQIPAAAQDQIIAGFKTCYQDRVDETDTSATPESCKKLTAANANDPMMATPQGQAAAKAIGAAMADAAAKANHENFAHAYQAGFIYDLILLAAVFGLSFTLPRHIRPEAFEEAA